MFVTRVELEMIPKRPLSSSMSLLIPIGGFGTKRVAGFIKSAFQVPESFGSFLCVVFLELGKKAIHRCRVKAPHYKASLSGHFCEIRCGTLFRDSIAHSVHPR